MKTSAWEKCTACACDPATRAVLVATLTVFDFATHVFGSNSDAEMRWSSTVSVSVVR